MTNDEISSNARMPDVRRRCFFVPLGLRLPRRSCAKAGHSFFLRDSMPVRLGPFIILFALTLSIHAEPPPSAQEILALIRMQQTEQQIDLNGQLRENGIVIPF